MLVLGLYDSAVATLAVLNLSLCVFIWVRRQVPGAIVGGGVVLCVTEVCVMFLLLYHTDSLENGYLYTRLRFLGLALLNPFLLIFVLQYTRLTHWVTPRVLAALFVVPILTQFMLWSEFGHRQFFVDWSLVQVGDYWLETRTLGSVYYIHALYNGMLFVVALAILVWYSRRVDSSRRRDLNILLGVCVMAAYGVATSATIGPEPGVRLTPLALGIASLIFGWLLIVRGQAQVMPVAYDLIFSTIHDAVLVLDPLDRIIKANVAAERLLNLPSAELLSRKLDTVMVKAEGWQPHGGGAAPQTVTIPGGGAPKVCEVRFLPLTRGEFVIGGLLVLRDITAERHALELAFERERSRVVANFIADASHEFRTPLSVIRSSAYLLSRQTEQEKKDQYVAKINDHVGRINALVDDLQVMAALDSERPLGHEAVDLRKTIQDVVDTFARPMAAARSQSVTLIVEPGLPVIMGDQDELTLGLEKVLHNAIRYTPEGGAITITAKRAAVGAQITISDTGVGMNESTAQAALRRFYRLDSARSTSGFGLGLPIAQKIMQRHGGDLNIDSSPGGGTRVTITVK